MKTITSSVVTETNQLVVITCADYLKVVHNLKSNQNYNFFTCQAANRLVVITSINYFKIVHESSKSKIITSSSVSGQINISSKILQITKASSIQ